MDGHLVINGSFLDLPTSGSGQYLRALLPYLAKQWEGVITVVRPVSKSSAGKASLPPPLPSSITITDMPLLISGNLGKLWFEQVALPWFCRSVQADLLFVPYFGPPLIAPCPVAVTVHDVIMLAVPEFAGSLLARLYTKLAAVATRQAAVVLADSQYSRGDAIRLAGLVPERIRVVPLAADPPDHRPDPALVRRLLQEKYQLHPGYILYIGGLDRRKDVSTLLQAYAVLNSPRPLAIAGEPRSDNPERFPDLRTLARELGIAERVRFLGWVPEEDKQLLYAGAGIFVFPSRYEGFGLTPLEAMAAGAPVVCSDATSLPEVVGDAALLFPAGDHAALAARIAQVLGDAELRERLRQSGQERAGQFSWERTATITVMALREAVRRPAEAAAR